MIDLPKEDMIAFFNKHTFQELIPIISAGLECGGELEDEGVMISIYKAGWSENEYIVGCLRDYRCKHRDNYIGNVYAVSYWAKDKETKWDYSYKITAEKKEIKK